MRFPASIGQMGRSTHARKLAWLALALSAAGVWWFALAPSGTRPEPLTNDLLNPLRADGGASIDLLPADQESVIASVADAVKRPGSVFHVRWVNDQSSNVEYEAWIASGTQSARVETRIGGDLDGMRIINGATISEYVIGGADSYAADSTGVVSEPYLKTLPYLSALAHAPNVSATQSTLGSKPVFLVTIESPIPSADGKELCSGNYNLYLESEVNRLPIRSETVRSCPNESPEVLEGIEYSVAEFLATESLAKAFFAGESVQDLFIGAQLERAKSLGFPVFAIEQPATLRLAHAEVREQDSGAPMVKLIYASTARQGAWLPDVVVAQGARGTMPDKTCESPAVLTKADWSGVTAHVCSGVSSGALIKFDNTTIYLYTMGHLNADNQDTNPFNSEEGLHDLFITLKALGQ